jgi:hypothetical protein
VGFGSSGGILGEPQFVGGFFAVGFALSGFANEE